MSTINYEHKLGCWVKMPFGEKGLAGAAGQLVHRLKQVQINNHGRAFSTFITNYSSANCIYLKEQFFLGVENISKHRLILWWTFFTSVNKALCAWWWCPAKQGSLGWCKTCECKVSLLGAEFWWCWVVLPGSPAKHSVFQAISTGCHTAVHKKRLQCILDLIWAQLSEHQSEITPVKPMESH